MWRSICIYSYTIALLKGPWKIHVNLGRRGAWFSKLQSTQYLSWIAMRMAGCWALSKDVTHKKREKQIWASPAFFTLSVRKGNSHWLQLRATKYELPYVTHIKENMTLFLPIWNLCSSQHILKGKTLCFHFFSLLSVFPHTWILGPLMYLGLSVLAVLTYHHDLVKESTSQLSCSPGYSASSSVKGTKSKQQFPNDTI